MRSGILRTYVATLRLRLDAPFPRQIKRRQLYRMKALRPVSCNLDKCMVLSHDYKSRF